MIFDEHMLYTSPYYTQNLVDYIIMDCPPEQLSATRLSLQPLADIRSDLLTSKTPGTLFNQHSKLEPDRSNEQS